MFKSKVRALACVALSLALPLSAVLSAQDAPKPPATSPATKPANGAEALPDGGAQLAPRIANLARETARQKVVFPPHFRQAAALMMACAKLDPQDPSYPRALYEAMTMPQSRDLEAARQWLGTYRKLAPQDQHAMVAYIDLTLQGYETADDRADYLLKILDAPTVPAEVRSHAAFRASQLARERGQGDLEDAMLGQAHRLNPLNMDVLRVRLEQQNENGTPAERLGTLLQMLRSNPVQPGATYRIARELADAGMVAEALQFYPLTVNLATATGVPMGREFALGYASMLYMSGITGQTQLFSVTKTITEQLLRQDVGDVEALLLQWYCQRAIGEADQENAAVTQAQILNAALNRLLVIRAQIGVTGPGATTRPVDTAPPAIPPDLAEDVEKLKDESRAAMRVPYAQALADLIWYQVYVARKADEAAKYLPLLKTALSDTHPMVVRIEGFIFLAQSQPDQAKVKLSAVADQDVLARMGLILIQAGDPARKENVAAEGRRLLSSNPAGILAAVLADAFKPFNVKLIEREDAPALRAALTSFPKDWLRIVEAPFAFYQLKAEMVDNRVLFQFGEPMMAKVSIRNVGQYDITVGPGGLLSQDLWFDANLRGLVQQQVLGAAYERLAAPLVLKPGQSIVQVLRLDQGALYLELASRPQPSITFFASVRTNPRGDGGFAPGGYGVPFSAITERGGFPLTSNSIQTLMQNLQQGSPAVRMRTLELMGVLAESIKQTQAGNAQLMALAKALLDAVDRSRQDPIPGVATWASFLTAVHAPEKRQVAMDKLLAGERSEDRMLGLIIANSLTPAQRKELATKLLKTEKEKMVQTYLEAMLELAEVEAMAATRPAGAATQPAGTGGVPGTVAPRVPGAALPTTAPAPVTRPTTQPPGPPAPAGGAAPAPTPGPAPAPPSVFPNR